MIPISSSEVRRLLEVTDRLGLHREAVVIPLARQGAGGLRLEEGRLILSAPATEFDTWLEALPGLISALDLARLKRVDPEDD